MSMTKIELFNAKNASKEISEGLAINVVSCGKYPDVDKDGHDVIVSCLKDESGEIYTTISGTVANSLDMLEEILAEEKKVCIVVMKGISNGGREFYKLMIKQ